MKPDSSGSRLISARLSSAHMDAMESRDGQTDDAGVQNLVPKWRSWG